MDILGVAPLIVVRDVVRSVEFYRRLGFRPAVQWTTYAKLTADRGAVVHLAAEGDAPAYRHSPILDSGGPQRGHSNPRSGR
jgi:catechol 2,3-dioxygenase-like lactoylglutathione lyase family enzyme